MVERLKSSDVLNAAFPSVPQGRVRQIDLVLVVFKSCNIVADLQRPCTGLVTLPSLASNVRKCIKEEDLFPTSLLHSWSKQTNVMVNLDK